MVREATPPQLARRADALGRGRRWPESRAEAWASEASRWDRLAPLYNLQLWLERPALARAIELADLGPTERLLDLGTGTGALLRQLAQRPAAPRSVVGIDSSQGMLARAFELPAGWKLVQGDVRALPFADASFEVVTASYLLQLLDEEGLNRALAESLRVLVPGGRFVAITPVAPRSFLARPYASLANGAARLAPSLFAGLRLLDPQEELERSGLALDRAVYVPGGYPSLCVLTHCRDGVGPETTAQAA